MTDPPRRPGFVRRHRVAMSVAAVAAAVAVAFVLVWFQPQKLFIDERVDDTAPGEATSAADAAVADGELRSLSHTTSGRALLLRLPDGGHLLRLEDLRTDNGPDLRVYLSPHPADGPEGDFDEDFLDLGAMKGNLGNQNYEIPRGVDVSRFRSAVLWCRRFSVGFGVAPLDPPG